MPKPRTGTLERRAHGGWYVRLTVTVDGESIRRWFALGTSDKAVAKRKAARLAKLHASTTPAAIAENAKTLETVADACTRIRAQRRAEGVRDVMNEEIRDRLYLIPAIGDHDITTIRAADIRAVLDEAAAAGKSHRTLKHIRAAANHVFGALWREELVSENVVLRVKVPKGSATAASALY